MQGNSINIAITVSYQQGSPQAVTLTASSELKDATYSFSGQTGTPTSTHPFNSNLTINVPTEVSSNIYTINITSTSANSKTASTVYKLTVLNAEIQVSGTVIADAHDDMFPTEIDFVSTNTNKTYSSLVDTSGASWRRWIDTKRNLLHFPSKPTNLSGHLQVDGF